MNRFFSLRYFQDEKFWFLCYCINLLPKRSNVRYFLSHMFYDKQKQFKPNKLNLYIYLIQLNFVVCSLGGKILRCPASRTFTSSFYSSLALTTGWCLYSSFFAVCIAVSVSILSKIELMKCHFNVYSTKVSTTLINYFST